MSYVVWFLVGLACGVLVYSRGYAQGARHAGEQLKRDLEALGDDE